MCRTAAWQSNQQECGCSQQQPVTLNCCRAAAECACMLLTRSWAGGSTGCRISGGPAGHRHLPGSYGYGPAGRRHLPDSCGCPLGSPGCSLHLPGSCVLPRRQLGTSRTPQQICKGTRQQHATACSSCAAAAAALAALAGNDDGDGTNSIQLLGNGEWVFLHRATAPSIVARDQYSTASLAQVFGI